MSGSLKKTILARFAVVGAILLAASTGIAVIATSIEAQISESLAIALNSARLVGELELDVAQVQGWLTDISATRAAEGFDDGFAEAEVWSAAFDEDVAALLQIHPEQRPLLDELSSTFDEFHDFGVEMAHAYIDGGPAAGNAMMTEFDGVAEAMANTLDSVHGDIDTDVAAMEAAAVGAAARLRTITIVGALLSLLGVVVVALRTAGSITRPISTIAAATTQAALGDTGVIVEHRSNDEIGQLADAVRSLTGYLDAHAATAEAIAAGDLEVEATIASENDTLGRAMQGMLVALGGVMNGIGTAVDALGTQATSMQSAAADMASSSESVAATITHLAGAGIEQTQATDEVSHNVTEIVGQVEEFASLTRLIVEAAGGAVAQTEHGAESVGVIHDTMRSTVAAIDEATAMVDDLGRRSEQVSQAVVLIQAIADQTNLLALNAAIEAARAGDAGRGFAVVATEVKQLAEQAGASAGQIAQIVGAMSDSVAKVVASTETGRAEVNRGADLIDRLESDLSAIRSASETVLENIRTADSRIEVVRAATEGIASRIAEVSLGAESNAAATEQVAAASEEGAATADEVARTADALGHVAATLRESLAAFRSTRV